MEIIGTPFGVLEEKEIEELKDIEAISIQCDGQITCENCPLSVYDSKCLADICGEVLTRNNELRGRI